jgi:hypothetical protein
MARYGGIQGFAGLFMIALLAVGLFQAGWRGVLTALLASWNAWPAIAKQERITTKTPTRIERAQRVGGIIGALLTCAGLVYGGWNYGWAWGSAGFITGLALGFTTEALRGVIHRVRHPGRFPDDDPPVPADRNVAVTDGPDDASSRETAPTKTPPVTTRTR